MVTELFRSGRSIMLVAAGWNLFDAAFHVVVDEVEPLRIAGNGIVVVAALIVHLVKSGRLASFVSAFAAVLVVVLNGGWAIVQGGAQSAVIILFVVTLGLLVWAAVRFARQASQDSDRQEGSWWQIGWVQVLGGAVAIVAVSGALFVQILLGSIHAQLYDDRLVDADYWSDEPVILSAGMGFDNIIGISDLSYEAIEAAGGALIENPSCEVEPSDGFLTSAAAASGIPRVYRGYADYDDGLPIVFSWPVLTDSVHPEDFRFTLNTGEVVVPHAAGMNPNWELGERNVVVVFGDFGNRGKAAEPDAVFPVMLEVVDDGTPLTLFGPGGAVSAVGMTWTTDATPYDSGPVLVGAKLNWVGDEPPGEGGVTLLDAPVLPNDEFALYGGGDFRLRMLTTGGFSADGVTGITPDQYSDFFRIHATGTDGSTVLITDVGVEYEVAGGTLRVVGLSDLGKAANDETAYDDCYVEDSDNYIDIILEGDEAAARNITHLEIPATGDYLPFYNPGGPGLEPFPGVRYTAPGPPDLEPVIIALDDPMRVSNP